MLNYLYPDAIDNFIKMQIKGLSQPTAQTLFKLLKLWVKEQDDNGRELDCLPEGAPEWAFERLNESTLYEFIPSDKTKEKLRILVSFVREIELIRKKSKNSYGKQFSVQLLRKLKRETVGTLSSKQELWRKNSKRPNILAELNCNNDIIPTINDRYWIECQSLEQLHCFGKELGKGCCLSQGHYDNDFIDRYSNGLKVFGLFSADHDLLAVASFYNDYLDDIEARGKDRITRQKGVENYHVELLKLLNIKELQVREDDPILIERTKICERTDITIPDSTQNNFRFWFDNTHNSLIIHHKNQYEYCHIDLNEISTSVNSAFGLLSLKKTVSSKPLFINRQRLFHNLCTALESTFNNGELELVFLTQFHEFTNTGEYWFNVSYNSSKTKIGNIYEYNGQAWWHDKQTDHVYRWCDNDVTPKIDSAVLNLIRDRVNVKYTAAGHFWGSLAQLSIYIPDLISDQHGEPRLSYASYCQQVLSKSEGWQCINPNNNDEYIISSREVDDYLCPETEQLICVKRGQGPVAGILVRKVSDRKRHFYIQAPGRDPKGYALLLQYLNTNNYSIFHVDHDMRFFDKPIEKLLVKRDNTPLIPTNRYSGIQLSSTVYHNHLYIFDKNDKLALIIKLDKESIAIDATLICQPDIISDEFHGIMSRVGITLTDRLNNVARFFGYHVVNDTLESIPPKPNVSNEHLNIEYKDNSVDVFYDDDERYIEISISKQGRVQLYGELIHNDISFPLIQNCIIQVTDFLNIQLSHDLEKAFCIDSTPTGYRAANSLPPSGWSCKGEDTFDEEDGILYWELDDEISEPVIRIQDGKVTCDSRHVHQLFKSQDKVQGFMDWYYSK